MSKPTIGEDFKMTTLSGVEICGNCGKKIEGNGIQKYWLYSTNTGSYFCGRCLIDVRKKIENQLN